MAMDEEGRLIDYFGGLRDIRERLIQTVGDPAERFHEDALRMLRALRFMSRLEFEPFSKYKKSDLRKPSAPGPYFYRAENG